MAGAGVGGWKALLALQRAAGEARTRSSASSTPWPGSSTSARADLAASNEQVQLLDDRSRAEEGDHRQARNGDGPAQAAAPHRPAARGRPDGRTPRRARSTSTVEFFEVNDEGDPIGNDRRQKFEIVGDRVYVECLVAKFDDKYVEENDLDRNTAICLFQRIFGEHQEPKDGFAIDQIGSSPDVVRPRTARRRSSRSASGTTSGSIANNPAKAAELGIRAAHADAPSIRVQQGRDLRAGAADDRRVHAAAAEREPAATTADDRWRAANDVVAPSTRRASLRRSRAGRDCSDRRRRRA